MFGRIKWSHAVMFLGMFSTSCGDARQPPGYDFPVAPPIWIVERDPKPTLFERKDLERDRKMGEMLVIPLYKDYQHQGLTDDTAIAHPFVYRQGEEIEERLASFGQRERLRRLIIWVPGYFPGSIGRTFPYVPDISGKRMIVLELQPCVPLEQNQLSTEMKTLLLDGNFTVEKMVAWKTRPPYSNSPTRVDAPYDFARLVRSEIFEGRFFVYGTARDYVLWAFSPGTQITNRLSDEDKKVVAAFATKGIRDREGVRRDGDNGG